MRFNPPFELVRDAIPFFYEEVVSGTEVASETKTVSVKAGYVLFVTKFRIVTGARASVKDIKVDDVKIHEDIGESVDHEIVSDDFQGIPIPVNSKIEYTRAIASDTTTETITVRVKGYLVPKEKKMMEARRW